MDFEGPPDGDPCGVEVPEIDAEMTWAEERQNA